MEALSTTSETPLNWTEICCDGRGDNSTSGNMSVSVRENFCNQSLSKCSDMAAGISLTTPILMGTTGVVGNIFALLILYSSRKEAHARRTVFFVMLSGLAWTDLLGLTTTSPIAVIMYANDLKWVGGPPLCRYHGFMMVSMGLVTPLIVCCMSLERYMAIRFSYFYTSHVTRRRAQMTFMACWVVTLIFASLPFVGFGGYELQFPGSWCFLSFHNGTKRPLDAVYAGLFGSLNILAILVMIFCNVRVAAALIRLRPRRTLRSPSIDQHKMSISQIGGGSSGTMIRLSKHSSMEAQMIWFLCLITIAFTVCWMPLNVHILITQFTGTTNLQTDLMVVRMASCNQILDPWLYVIFRKGSFMRIVRRIKSCLYPTVLHKPPPRQPRPGKMRYVICNKSFTYDVTSVGRTNGRLNGVGHVGNGMAKLKVSRAMDSPPCPYMDNIELVETPPVERKLLASDSSDDSASVLISVCPYCSKKYEDGRCRGMTYPVYDLQPGDSPTPSPDLSAHRESTFESGHSFETCKSRCQNDSPFQHHTDKKERLQETQHRQQQLPQRTTTTTTTTGNVDDNLICIVRPRPVGSLKRVNEEDQGSDSKTHYVVSLPMLNIFKNKLCERSSDPTATSSANSKQLSSSEGASTTYHSLDSDHCATTATPNAKRTRLKLCLAKPFPRNVSTASITNSPAASPKVGAHVMPSFSSPSNSTSNFFSSSPDREVPKAPGELPQNRSVSCLIKGLHSGRDGLLSEGNEDSQCGHREAGPLCQSQSRGGCQEDLASYDSELMDDDVFVPVDEETSFLHHCDFGTNDDIVRSKSKDDVCQDTECCVVGDGSRSQCLSPHVCQNVVDSSIDRLNKNGAT